MTALAGLAFTHDGGPAQRDCARMLAAQQLYGTDGTAQANLGQASLGRALALRLPEDAYDRQPITFGNGRFALVADCRIDNRARIAADCEIPTTETSDAAIIAAAYDRWGRDCFDRLRGDFAVAIWDAQDRCFILARDALGTTPLYYHHSRDMVAFSSMPQGLNALPQLPGKPDTDFVASTLRDFSVDGCGSYWRGIDRVRAGHIVTLDFGGASQRRYWHMPDGRLRLKDKRDYAAALREKIETAVSSRIRGETRIATHLSAGLDSSSITGAAATQMGDSGRIFAFTHAPRAGYAVDHGNVVVDESTAAAATAALHPNVEHIVVRSGEEWATRAVDRHFELAQQPAVNICNLAWIHAINDQVQQRGIKVIMPGQLGNLAMTYDGLHMLAEPFAHRDWRRLLANLIASGPGRLRLISQSLTAFGPSWYRRLRPPYMGRAEGIGPGRDNDATRSGDMHVKPSYRDAIITTASRVDIGPNRKALLAGWGIDERDPTMDRDLFDFTATLPLHVFRAGRMNRALIRKAAHGWAAPAVLNTDVRGYQGADWHEGATRHRDWIANEVDAIADHAAADDLLDTQKMANLVSNWPDDGWATAPTMRAYRLLLLRGISVGHFVRRASGSNR